ncbi:MAG: hypothetical protein AMJ53_05185 [Gammaproteobacteria bacterium SG8_11]|nr:MAG: hypothetical protein AMJ53_05185 [Gammaproteobacteria bacterium SG8_11]
MAKIDKTLNQLTLDALRAIRSKLYAIPESELNGMGLEDQIKYGDSIHQVGQSILKLEAAKLKEVNDKFKKKEKELETAAASLEQDVTALTKAVEVIRVVSSGISLIKNIVKLLG